MMRQLERVLGWAVIPNLTAVLVIGQAIMCVLFAVEPKLYPQMLLHWPSVFAGEVWRVGTFLFIPLAPGLFFPLFQIFALWLLWMFGRLLEAEWGAFRFNLYCWIAALMAMLGAALTGGPANGSAAIDSTIFIAAAWIIPDFQILVFFVLPVKIKWLGALTWALLGFSFVASLFAERYVAAAMILASVLNFFLFFGKDLWGWVRRKQRTAERKAEAARVAATPMHTCAACGRTDLSDPELSFRYATDSAGEPLCYCEDHLPG